MPFANRTAERRSHQSPPTKLSSNPSAINPAGRRETGVQLELNVDISQCGAALRLDPINADILGSRAFTPVVAALIKPRIVQDFEAMGVR